MRLLFSAVVYLTGGLAVAQAQQAATYVNNTIKFPLGAYFKFDKTYFRIRGAEEVKGLGSYGRVTGKGPLGAFVINGFKSNGMLDGLSSLETRAAKSKGKFILQASVDANASGDISNVDFSGGVKGDTKIDKDEDYAVIIIRPGDWEEMYRKLSDEYQSGDAGKKHRFQDPKFRVVDSVVYATSLKIKSITSVNGTINAAATVPKINVSGQVGGSGTNSTTFELTRGQIIAYSFRRLCWDNGAIVEAREDNPGNSDNSNCNDYQ
nr:hypothetical protein [uncultured Cohaesibacter sp.]